MNIYTNRGPATLGSTSLIVEHKAKRTTESIPLSAITSVAIRRSFGSSRKCEISIHRSGAKPLTLKLAGKGCLDWASALQGRIG